MSDQDPSRLEEYLFDLRGYIVVEDALSADEVKRLNLAVDWLPALDHMEWHGNAQRRDYTSTTGFELHNCVEAGEPFEELIDHPSWINHLAHFAGEKKSYVQGLFIDECVLSIRGRGGHHPAHSGGYRGALRGAYGFNNGVFRCGQTNVIVALTDVGPGDGATMIVPGSHKSNFDHPNLGNYGADDAMDGLDAAVELHMKAGDALLFVDGLTHGGCARLNDGARRVLLYRYGVSWGATRYGFCYSRELLDRLTPERRKILQPIPPNLPPPE